VAFGDSITFGEIAQPLLLGGIVHRLMAGPPYPVRLQNHLVAKYPTQTPVVINEGLSGEYASSGSAVARFSSVLQPGVGAVLIMEGSNDVNEQSSGVANQAISNLRQMIQIAKSRGVRPLLATIPPMIAGRPNAQGAAGVDAFNTQLRGVAASEGIPLVDIHQAFGASAPSLIGSDGLHPNQAGMNLIADTFSDAVQAVFGVP
jgi:lysophospholipase L1-like esterase